MTIGLLVTPVCYHRRVFQSGRKQELVWASHCAVTTALITTWLTVLGAVVLVLSLVLQIAMALLLSGLVGVVLGGLWWLLPNYGGAARTKASQRVMVRYAWSTEVGSQGRVDSPSHRHPKTS